MNLTDDQRFFDLAMKAIGHKATEAERAELERMAAARPDVRDELHRLQREAEKAKAVLPLMEATQSTGPEFPAYARERLQTKVQETLKTAPANRARAFNWRLLLGVAGAAAVLILMAIPRLAGPSRATFEIAMLDPAGALRGGGTNDIAALQQHWPKATVQKFEKVSELETWRRQWPNRRGPVAKLIYDRSAGELRVILDGAGKPIEKSFTLDPDLPTALAQVDQFVRDQTRR